MAWAVAVLFAVSIGLVSGLVSYFVVRWYVRRQRSPALNAQQEELKATVRRRLLSRDQTDWYDGASE